MNQAKQSPLLYLLLLTLTATLGGFLFGFDSGVISGAVGALRDAFGADAFASGFNVSSMLLGCALGALLAGDLSDHWGRLNVLRLAALFFLVSAWGSGIADTSGSFIFYRVLGGLAVGAASVICPAYIAEISPAHLRGRLGSLQQMAIVVGLFVSFMSNYLLVKLSGAAGAAFWFGYETFRWMFWMEIIPAALFGVMLFLIPESPRHLARKGKKDAALQVLRKLGHSGDAEEKLQEITASFCGAEKARLKNLWNPATGKIHPVVFIGLLLAAFQQLSGINVVFYYGPIMWQAAGFTESSGLIVTVLTGALNIISTLIAISLVDKLGRKPLLFFGAIGMTICLTGVAFIFSMAPVQANGALELNPASGLLSLIFANGYVACFAVTWGPVVWVLLGEMFPNRLRGIALSIAGTVMWLSNFLITISFESLLELIGLGAAYGIYATFAFLSVFFVARYLRETKGKTLEQMS